MISIAETLAQFENNQLSVDNLVNSWFAAIKTQETKLNAFITLTQDEAHQQAQAVDKLRKSGRKLPLAGIPIAHKDNFCTKGIKTSCGSKMLDNFIAPYDATVVSNLKEAGSILLGKTNMDEFAMGSSSEVSFYGPVNNPWDPARVPGGSSGGSAAAVAAGLVLGATGTDTGGSIRQPASFCGITGLKPTYGRISRFGMVAHASSLDQAGLLARSAQDIALMLQSFVSHDPLDSTSINQPIPEYLKLMNESISGTRLGLPRGMLEKLKDKKIEQLLNNFITSLEAQGATIVDIELPHIDLAAPIYYVIAPAECSSNLARFDGVRFGHRSESADNILDLYLRSRAEGFDREVKTRIMTGTYVLSSGYYDDYYVKAQKIRRLIRDDFLKSFESIDAIVMPTTPTTAFEQGEKTDDPIEMYLSDIFTLPANLAGLPAISIPIGFVNNLPIGGQLIGQHFAEEKLLQVAHQYQQKTEWHLAKPPIFHELNLRG